MASLCGGIMDSDDVYDVRVVEARLARMEAARRARSLASTAPSNETQRLSQQARAVVGDFELSQLDGSFSDTSSDDEEHPMSAARQANAKLRDSLDLSMSMSMAMPMEPVATRTRPPAQPKPAAVASREQAARIVDVPAVDLLPTSSMIGAIKIEPHGEEVCAGRLVQRRRQLERRVEPPEPPKAVVQHPSPSVQMTHLPRRDLSGTREEALAPQPIVDPMLKREGLPVSCQELVPPRALANPQSKTKPAAKIQEPTRTVSAMDTHKAQREGDVTGAESARNENLVNTTGSKSNVHDGKRKDAVQSAPIPPTAIVVRQLVDQGATPVPPPRQPPKVERPGLKVPPVNTMPFKKLSALGAPPQVNVPPVATLGASTKPPGYARSTGTTNQVSIQPALPVKAIGSPTKQGPEDDVIDDLLTAEELRLRESLDKLSQRLCSISTAARTTTTKGCADPPSNQSPSLESSKKDDAKTVRSASYGGGTHSRLHQPTSPTARASHSRRTELSGGVHKARVRTGGVTAQEAAANRMDTLADGKHKITVKRDLAHLLF